MNILYFASGLGLLAALPTALGVFRTRQTLKKHTSEFQPKSSITHAQIRSAEFGLLPQPVARYFKHVLKEGQPAITRGKFSQSGKLRLSVHSQKWMSFTAQQNIYPLTPGFLWNARVRLFGPIHIRVIDSYAQGVGRGLVKLLSALTVGKYANKPELNSGALHRYLAEAVWCPTALLPQFGVAWSFINRQRALATLQDGDVCVSLEFRFNDRNEVSGIYSPGRWGTFQGDYKQVAWEGHFSCYQEIQGLLVPTFGEVGWYDKGEWHSVWEGQIKSAVYRFD